MKVNLVQIAGYLNYPKLSKTTNGKSHFTGSLAVFRTKKEGQNAEYDYIRIEAFDTLADLLANVKENQEILVTGQLRHNKWKDPMTGESKYTDFVLVNHCYKEIQTYRAEPTQTAEPYYPDDTEDDYPF